MSMYGFINLLQCCKVISLQLIKINGKKKKRVTLGSIELMRVGASGPGHLQSSAASPRRLGIAGSEDSCLGPGGDVQIPGGDLVSRPLLGS